jgi:hypothetical protein
MFADLIVISVLFQQKGVYPLPLNHFFELCPPVGHSVLTPPIQTRRDIFRFQTAFSLGDRSDANIEALRKSDFNVKFWHLCPMTARIQNDLVGIATAAMAPLVRSNRLSVPLRFTRMDNRRTEHRFHLTITTPHPLFCQNGLSVDIDIYALPETLPAVPIEIEEPPARNSLHIDW